VGRAVLIFAVCAALLCGAATAATSPAGYRAQVNAICRAYTPYLKKEAAAATKAKAAKNTDALATALGHIVALGIDQNRRIESVAIPAALRLQMTPIIAALKQIDAHARRAVALAGAGDGNGAYAELTATTTLSGPLRAKFDAAGLRDCGSNQGL
jgi:hypothetical protein